MFLLVFTLNDGDDDEHYLCRKYEVASKCVSYLLYACSDIKAEYKTRLDQFEYACSHLTIKDSMHSCVCCNLCNETMF